MIFFLKNQSLKINSPDAILYFLLLITEHTSDLLLNLQCGIDVILVDIECAPFVNCTALILNVDSCKAVLQ
jgi:hypothetical protein